MLAKKSNVIALSIDAGLVECPVSSGRFFSPAMVLGIGHGNIRLAGEGDVNHLFIYDLVVPQGNSGKLPVRDWIWVWLIDGASDVLYQFSSEIPNPLPENHGQCGLFGVGEGARRAGVEYAGTDAEGNAVRDCCADARTKETDANLAFGKANSVYGIPYRPLKLGTLYAAHFVGRKNSVARLSLHCTFIFALKAFLQVLNATSARVKMWAEVCPGNGFVQPESAGKPY